MFLFGKYEVNSSLNAYSEKRVNKVDIQKKKRG